MSLIEQNGIYKAFLSEYRAYEELKPSKEVITMVNGIPFKDEHTRLEPDKTGRGLDSGTGDFTKNEGGVVKDIFDMLDEQQKTSLFKDESIFGVDYTPKNLSEIFHRDGEITSIAKSIQKATKGERIEVYIYGTTGVGKSYLVRGVLNEAKIKFPDKFQYAWVNCKTISPISEFQVSKAIVAQLEKPFETAGLSAGAIKEKIIEQHKNKPLLLVLDEVDALAEVSDNLLYTFFEAGISQFLISNNFTWTDMCDDRIKSRSKNNRIDFAPYTPEQLSGILKFIAGKGLDERVVSDAILLEIARLCVNQFYGDLRKAKNLMYASVDEVMKERMGKVSDEHVQKALERISNMDLTQMLSNFSLSEKVALAAYVAQRLEPTEKGRPATTERIYEFFKKDCKENGLDAVVGRTMMKNHLGRLELGGFLTHEKKSYETQGRTNFYDSEYSPYELGLALLDLGVKLPLSRSLGEAFGDTSQRKRLEGD
jgi:orc1/cdc6 family replication initiation protein